jgi:hypothetical protein
MTKHSSIVKEAVGEKAIAVLSDLFHRTHLPKWVPAQRFRADHPEWIQVIDKLENTGLLIERSRDGKDYRVKLFALPLIAENSAGKLVLDMDRLFPVLQELYREHLSTSFTIADIASASKIDEERLRRMFVYMSDAHGWCGGWSNEFPFGNDATFVISEGVLAHAEFSELISQMYEWHFVNAKNKAPSWDSMSLRVTEGIGDGFFTQADISGVPAWYADLEPPMRAIIDEIDRSMRSDLLALPTMGIRTLVDLIMSEKGYAKGTFSQRLEQFTEEGWIPKKHKDVVAVVLDAGNASAHRAHFPNPDDLQTCVSVVKHLLEGVYVLRPKVDRLKGNTPQRES